MEVALWLMVTLRSLFWATASSTPVTVTVCAVFQSLVLNVKVAGLTVAAPVSPEVTVMVTLAVGSVFSATV